MATSPLNVDEVAQVFREVAHEDPFMRCNADQIRADLSEWMTSSGVEPTGDAIDGALCALTYLPQRLRQTDRPIEDVLPNAVTALADMREEPSTAEVPDQRDVAPTGTERMEPL